MANSRTIRTACIAAAAISLAAFTNRLQVQAQEEQQQPPVPQAGPEHRILQKDVGTWDAEITVFSPQEGVPPMKSKGSEKNELLPGGMWLVSRFQGEMIGMPFTGVGTTGYDPVEKKYVGTWIDTMTPHMMIVNGDYDAATKTMTSTGEGRDVATREMYSAKLVTRFIDDNTRTFELSMRGADGNYFKVMEIAYKRRSN